MNVCDGLQQAVTPRFNTIVERSRTLHEQNVSTKEPTALSLSEMKFHAETREAWISKSSSKENSQIPLLEGKSSSKVTFTNK